MLLLLHGQILLFIPAAFFLGLAALLFAILKNVQSSNRGGVLYNIIVLFIFIVVVLGLVCLLGFLGEFWYFIKYSLSGHV